MASKEPVERRTISKLLQTRHGWSVKTNVDGKVRVAIPGARDPRQFAKEVREAVEALGYAPRVYVRQREIVVTTAETERQADEGRGVHGAQCPERPEREFQPVERARSVVEPSSADVQRPTARPKFIRLMAEEVAALPWVRALRPIGKPYLETLSPHSELQAWHVEVALTPYVPRPDEATRWLTREGEVAETWQKSPLVEGDDSGCKYSCGEVELAARLRAAGFKAYWISEWSGFPHVSCWEAFCVKRSELQHRLPVVHELDVQVRTSAVEIGLHLGTRGGHPDVIAWSDDTEMFYYCEYKGPGDDIKPKQNTYAQALAALHPESLRYIAVRGTARPVSVIQAAV